MTLCDTFRRQAIWTWDSLRQARQVSCQIGEESLTDFNLLRLRLRHPDEIFIRSFTKPAESRTGADWEWWLTGPSGDWLGFRVQAKVLDLATETFRHLHYQLKSGMYQSEVLIKASANQPPRIPIYCFYLNVTDWRRLRRVVPLDIYRASVRSLGCSLLDAREVERLRANVPTDLSLDRILPTTIPWHYLVCPHVPIPGDLPSRARAIWSAQYGGELPALTKNPPDYVLRVLYREPVEVLSDASIPSHVTVIRELREGGA